MSLLFVNENNAYIGIEAIRFFVKYSDGMKKMMPAETLESITIMGHAQMTTQCVQECLKRGIPKSKDQSVEEQLEIICICREKWKNRHPIWMSVKISLFFHSFFSWSQLSVL